MTEEIALYQLSLDKSKSDYNNVTQKGMTLNKSTTFEIATIQKYIIHFGYICT